MKISGLSTVILALVCLTAIVQLWGAQEQVTWWRYGAALLIAGLMYEWFAIRSHRLIARVDTAGHLKLGRPQSLSLEIINNSARRQLLVFVPALPEDISADEKETRADIGPGDTAVFDFAVTANDIGKRLWPGVPGRLKGPLGLAWWPLKLVLDVELSVVPDIMGSSHPVRGSQQLGEKVASPGAGVELHHLREYVPGDPLHSINWKATARSQKLITQVMSEEQHLEIMLVLDIGRTCRTRVDGMSQFGHYINLASTFAQLALDSGDYVGLVAAADRPVVALPPRSGARAMMHISEALRNLQPLPVEVDMLSAALEVQRLTRNRSLILLITDLYGQSLSGNYARSLKLWGRRHLPFVVGLVGEEVIALGQQQAAGDKGAYTSLAAVEYRGAMEANAEAARRMGARAIIARPSELQSRVVREYRQLKAKRQV